MPLVSSSWVVAGPDGRVAQSVWTSANRHWPICGGRRRVDGERGGVWLQLKALWMHTHARGVLSELNGEEQQNENWRAFVFLTTVCPPIFFSRYPAGVLLEAQLKNVEEDTGSAFAVASGCEIVLEQPKRIEPCAHPLPMSLRPPNQMILTGGGSNCQGPTSLPLLQRWRSS